MSYDIELKDPVTKETIEIAEPHFMRGGTYAIGGTQELWLNITYNYSHYYYEATDGDPRFAHDEVSCYYADGTQGPIETQYGIRGIYGKTGAESVQMLKDMIWRIETEYKDENGEWITTKRKKHRLLDPNGKVYESAFDAIINNLPRIEEEYEIEINEGPNEDYWEPTAGNAIKPLYQLIAFAQMRPDGIWDGD